MGKGDITHTACCKDRGHRSRRQISSEESSIAKQPMNNTYWDPNWPKTRCISIQRQADDTPDKKDANTSKYIVELSDTAQSTAKRVPADIIETRSAGYHFLRMTPAERLYQTLRKK
jgi:hypothetical protein